jgi:outer membrane protein OmpA-like peptidoglycan-associated protein
MSKRIFLIFFLVISCVYSKEPGWFLRFDQPGPDNNPYFDKDYYWSSGMADHANADSARYKAEEYGRKRFLEHFFKGVKATRKDYTLHIEAMFSDTLNREFKVIATEHHRVGRFLFWGGKHRYYALLCLEKYSLYNLISDNMNSLKTKYENIDSVLKKIQNDLKDTAFGNIMFVSSKLDSLVTFITKKSSFWGAHYKISSNILFETGVTKLSDVRKYKAQNEAILNDLLVILKSDTTISFIEIMGHADSTPPKQEEKRDNITFAEERALSVKEFLISHDIQSDKIINAIGLGVSDPEYANLSDKDKTLNRCVEVFVYRQ